MKRIVLIGMPGVGKSTTGVILAKKMGLDYVDEDILICKREGTTLPKIIEEKGVEALLAIEEQVGLDFDRMDCVLATGGSAVFSEKAMNHLKKDSIMVWLYAPLEVIEERLSHGSRENRGVAAPADMTVEDIFNLRMPLYEKYADVRIVCDSYPEELCDRILEACCRVTE